MCYKIIVTTALSGALLVLGGVIVLGSIRSILDARIVDAAVPTLARRFAASISATAFANSFWLATALVAVALAPALLLPRRHERTASHRAVAA